jgi:hypothetical protein
VTTPAESELAAIRLKERALRMVGLLRRNTPTVLIEEQWKLIEEAHNELRVALEKKVSEG